MPSKHVLICIKLDCRSHPSLPLLRRSTWPAVTGAAAATLQSATTPACPTWSSTASTWSSSKACSTCCSPGPTAPTQTPWLCASSVSWTKTETPSSIFGSSSAALVSRMRFCVCVCVLAQTCPFPLMLVVFLGVLCHGDLTEKLKLLYKMHVIPGECAATRFIRL